jgi:hypothetical protein
MEDLADPEKVARSISDSEAEILAQRIIEMVKDDVQLGNLVELIMETDRFRP